MTESDVGRRHVLLTVGAGATAAVAGCADTDTDTDTESSSYTGDGGSTGGDEIELRVGSIDLSEIATSQLASYSAAEIADQYSAQIELEGVDADLDEADDFYVDIPSRRELDTTAAETYIDAWVEADGTEYARLRRPSIPEFLVRDGETVQVHVEYAGQTIDQEATVDKQLPNLDETGYLIEGYLRRDGERIYQTPHQDAFLFTTVDADIEDYEQRRREAANQLVNDTDYQNSIDNLETEELEDALKNVNEEKERKAHAAHWISLSVRNFGVGSLSGDADRQAATEEKMLRNLRLDDNGEIYFVENHTEDPENQLFENVYANGFNNPASRNSETTGNHGSKVLYIDHDWYHSETTMPRVRHVDNLDEIDMAGGMTPSRNSEFVSVAAQFREGDMPNLRFNTKMNRKHGFFISQVNPYGEITGNDFTMTDEHGSEGLEMIRENRSRIDVLGPSILAARYNHKTEHKVIASGTPRDPTLIATNNEDVHDRILDDRGFQNTATVTEAILT